MNKNNNLWLRGYRLATAEILFRMPDHPDLLQSYVWQDLDLAPDYPVLTKFLEFWQLELDGQLYSVNVDSTDLVTPEEFRYANVSLSLH